MFLFELGEFVLGDVELLHLGTDNLLRSVFHELSIAHLGLQYSDIVLAVLDLLIETCDLFSL